MILKTNKAVTFNKAMTGTETQVLIGSIISRQRNGQHYFGANYVYALEDGTNVMTNAFHLKSTEEILALNAMIEKDLPVYEETEETYFEELKVFLAFRLEMFNMLTALNPDLKLEDILIEDVEVTYNEQ